MRGRVYRWIGDNALNAIASLTLRLVPPMRANAWIVRVASFYPRLGTPSAATRMLQTLGERGSCLSRSLAVVARYPGAEVVIGVVPPRADFGAASSFGSVNAHAWIEVDGLPLDAQQGGPWV